MTKKATPAAALEAALLKLQSKKEEALFGRRRRHPRQHPHQYQQPHQKQDEGSAVLPDATGDRHDHHEAAGSWTERSLLDPSLQMHFLRPDKSRFSRMRSRIRKIDESFSPRRPATRSAPATRQAAPRVRTDAAPRRRPTSILGQPGGPTSTGVDDDMDADEFRQWAAEQVDRARGRTGWRAAPVSGWRGRGGSGGRGRTTSFASSLTKHRQQKDTDHDDDKLRHRHHRHQQHPQRPSSSSAVSRSEHDDSLQTLRPMVANVVYPSFSEEQRRGKLRPAGLAVPPTRKVIVRLSERGVARSRVVFFAGES